MSDLGKLLRFVKPYWRRSLAALILLTSLVFLDLSIPRLIERIIDQGITLHNQPLVIQTALLMLGISLVSTLIAIGNNNLSVGVGERVARDLREALFLKIQSYSYGNLDRQNTGQLMVRLTSDVNALNNLTRVSLRIGTRAPLLFLGSLILMVSTSQSLALAMLPLLAITTVVIVFFIVKTEPLFRLVQQRLDRLNTVLQENIAGARLVKAFVRADFESQRFDTVNEDLTARSIRVMEFTSAMAPTLTMLINIGIVLVIWYGGLQAIQGGLSIGHIVAFINYLITTLIPLTLMTMLANTWASGMASARRVNEILETAPEVQDPIEAQPLMPALAARIEFREVGFSYSGDGHEAVLENVNLTAEPGQTVAFLGATGAGKSTVVNLVPRFYDVTSGAVLIDGVDVRQLKQDELLGRIAVVPQESLLFSGTVRDNIRYGRPDASDAEVEAAARAAQAHDFIMALPDGYGARVEPRGANFSGGQKQRLAIARAILLQPEFLILDDSTSSVDVETEIRIQDALKEVMRGRTSLVVAQRISTVLNADKILVIDQGCIVAQGTHKELLKTSPIYQEIYASQLGNGFHLDEVVEGRLGK